MGRGWWTEVATVLSVLLSTFLICSQFKMCGHILTGPQGSLGQVQTSAWIVFLSIIYSSAKSFQTFLLMSSPTAMLC